MLARDDTEVVSKLPRMEDLHDLPPGVLAEIIQDIVDRKATDEAPALFQSGIAP